MENSTFAEGKEKILNDYSNFLNTKQLGKRSKYLYQFVVRSFFNWLNNNKKEFIQATANEWLVKNPKLYRRAALNYLVEMLNLNWKLEKIKERKTTKPIPPTREQLKNLLEKVKKEDEELYWFFCILYYTGERKLAVLNMKLSDIDFERGQVKFHTKGEKMRAINLPNWFVNEFKEWVKNKKGVLENEKFFFIKESDYLRKRDNPNDEVISEEASKFRLWYRIENLKTLTLEEKAILQRTHNFRRVMINWILETGDILEAKSFIGHEDISTTQRYVSELMEMKKKQIVEEKIKKEMEMSK